MLFNSNIFLFWFLPLFLITFYIVPVIFRKYFVLLSGMAFFFWGAPLFFFILIFSSVVDYFLSSFFKKGNNRLSKLFLIVSLSVNLGLLFYYKYTGFFVDNVNLIIKSVFNGKLLPDIKIVLPLGISFITFHKISFIIDVYRKPVNRSSFIDYLNYIFFFPKMLSGPIQQWNGAARKYLFINRITATQSLSGIYRFSLGIFKKVWIANVLGAQIDIWLGAGLENMSSWHAWLLIFSYGMQLLFDFSAYTDMACGIALMTGIKLPENFNNPYAASSIRDFWQRWHISLTSWFRNYLFLPLAFRFSRRFKKEKYFSLKSDYWIYILSVIITFLLTGLWHGAAWTFILWGLYHGLLLVIDRLFLFRLFKKSGKFVSVPITFLLVLLGWVIFIVPGLNSLSIFMKILFEFSYSTVEVKPLFTIVLITATVFAFIAASKKSDIFLKKWFNSDVSSGLLFLKTLMSIIFLILAMSGIAAGGFSPFIYFRF